MSLLNFYKVLSNVATKLVGAFIPVIVLQATGSVVLACVLVAAEYLLKLATVVVFRKFFETKPQIALIIRIVPVVLYSLSIFLIDTNMWVGIIGVIVFYGMGEAFKYLPMEYIYNYASANEDGGNSMGLTRLLEQAGVLIAVIVGGFIMDINRNIILTISIVLYLISVIPLVVYYVKSKNEKGFNKDSVSNAAIEFSKEPELNKLQEKQVHKMLSGYWFVYFIFCFMDVVGIAYIIHLYLLFSSYGITGTITAVYNAMYGVGCYVFGLIDNKKETTPLLVTSCVICMLGVGSLIFVTNTPLLFVINILVGLAYGCVSMFCLRRMIPKSRIMGCANRALFNREVAANIGVIAPMMLGVMGSMIPVIAAVAAAIGFSGYLIPANEERSRKILINYLQTHENYMQEKAEKKRAIKKNRVCD